MIVLFTLIMFATLELGIVTYEKMALSSAVREAARLASVEGGFSENVSDRARDILASFGMNLKGLTLKARPKQAIYGTTITVEATYSHRVLSPPVALIAGTTIELSAKAVTRSEFVPR